MRSSPRSFLAAVVSFVACVAVLVTLLAHYANVLTSSASFSNRAVSLVQTSGVQSLIVDAVTNRVLAEVGDQTSVRPVVEDAVSRAMSNPQITGEIRAAAGLLQSELVSGEANALTLTLPNIGAAVASVVRPTSQQLAAIVSRIGTITVVDVPIPPGASSSIHDLATLGQDFQLLVVLSALLIVLALMISADRWRTLMWLGFGALVSGVLVVVIYLVGREVVVAEFSNLAARAAARAAWGVYLQGLESSGLLLAAVGAALAALSALIHRQRRQYSRASAAPEGFPSSW